MPRFEILDRSQMGMLKFALALALMEMMKIESVIENMKKEKRAMVSLLIQAMNIQDKMRY